MVKDNTRTTLNIEDLGLPKRHSLRQSLHTGEQNHCYVKYGSHQTKVEIVDLSHSGLAFVIPATDTQFPCHINQTLNIEFQGKRSLNFNISGTVSNIKKNFYASKELSRVGVAFKVNQFKSLSEFRMQIGAEFVVSRSEMKLQGSAIDPFFFSEDILLQIEAFTPEGFEASLIGTHQAVIPGQILELTIFVPGRGLAKAKVKNSHEILISKEQNRRYFSYQGKAIALKKVISEYLISSLSIAPNYLRKASYLVGDISKAFRIRNRRSKNKTLSNIAVSGLIFGYTDLSITNISNKIRYTSFYLGNLLIGELGLIFYSKNELGDQIQKRQFIESMNHSLSSYMEVVNLKISNEVTIKDFFIPLLRHLLRMTYQARVESLLIMCDQQAKHLLTEMGFETIAHDQQDRVLLSVDIKKALLNRNNLISKQIWNTIYGDLYLYFKEKFELNTTNKKYPAQ